MNITVEQILENPFNYEDMLVHVTYKTNWQNLGNEMRQETANYTGRISFISTRLMQIKRNDGTITVPLGHFISITKADDKEIMQLVKENMELKTKLNRLTTVILGFK